MRLQGSWKILREPELILDRGRAVRGKSIQDIPTSFCNVKLRKCSLRKL